jgi:hypothetical protein
MSPLQWAAAVVLIVLMPIALVIATEVGRSPFEPGEAATELAALEAKLGYPPHAVSVELQNPATPQTTDEYRIEHIQALHGLIDWNRIIGPDPIQSNRPGPSVPQRVFDLNPSDFTQVPRIARAAVDRVALQEPATATAMVLTKPTLFPELRLGPLGWTVTVKSAHETAEASFDPTGQPTGIDLSGTIRARTLDLYQGGPPLLDIAHAITARYDGKERVDRLLVYRTSISFDLVSGGTVAPPRQLFQRDQRHPPCRRDADRVASHRDSGSGEPQPSLRHGRGRLDRVAPPGDGSKRAARGGGRQGHFGGDPQARDRPPAAGDRVGGPAGSSFRQVRVFRLRHLGQCADPVGQQISLASDGQRNEASRERAPDQVHSLNEF